MKAARFIEPENILIQETTIPKPANSEILVKVKTAGICGTDLHIYHGTNKGKVKPKTVLGHEFAGIVEEIGNNVSGFQSGDRVAIQPNLFCGQCHYCRNAKQHFCENWSAIGINRDGGFQEFCSVPVSAAYKFPETISYENAAFFEPLACVLHGISRSKIQISDTVILQGAGGIGQLFIKVLAQMGLSDIIVSDIDDNKLKLAQKNGANHTVNVKNESLQEVAMSVTNGYGAQIMIDAAGLETTIPDAVSLLENTGKVLVFGVPPENRSVEMVPYDVYRKELEIIGSYTNPYSNEASIKMLSKINAEDLITDRIALENLVEDGFKKMGLTGVLKIQVQI